MTDTTSQMLEAKAQLKSLLRGILPIFASLLVVMLCLEIYLSPGVPKFAFGFLVGCIYSALNLVMLFWFLAPYFFRREKRAYFIFGIVVSLIVGGLLMFAATRAGTLWAIGLAFGVASPAFFTSTRLTFTRY